MDQLPFDSNLFTPRVLSMYMLPDDGQEIAAKLIWEKGELGSKDIYAPTKAMPISMFSPENNFTYRFDRPCAGETLEAVVNQGTRLVPQNVMTNDPSGEHGGGAAANLTTMDALVPCSVGQGLDMGLAQPNVFSTERVGSCSDKNDRGRRNRKCRRRETGEESSAARVPSSEWSDTLEWESEKETSTWGFTSTSRTSIPSTKLNSGNKRITDRSKAQRRRDKKKKMSRLMKMVQINQNKVDEVIEHLKQLQSQVEAMNKMNMTVPPAAMMMDPILFMGMGRDSSFPM